MNFAVLGMGGGELLLAMFIILPIILLTTVFWIMMLISAIQNKGLTDNERICWVLAIIFLHILGAFLYLIIGHPKRPPLQKEA